jgi:amino-acid N-acetyltransferase
MNIQPVSENQFQLIIDLLIRNNLPVSDLSSETRLFALMEENELIGSIGLEVSQNNALLRSLCVDEKHRNKGAAVKLVKFLEEFAKQEDIENIYLLTTTAEQFFSNRNYVPVDRNSVPYSIQQTSEFKSVCPASATIMIKRLFAEQV